MIVYNKTEAGKRLRQVIKDERLNSRQFALKIKGDPSYVAKMEKGEKGISKTYLNRIEKIFGINIQWLLFGTGAKKIADQSNGATAQFLTMQVLADLALANKEIAESINILSKNQEMILAKMSISTDLQHKSSGQ